MKKIKLLLVLAIGLIVQITHAQTIPFTRVPLNNAIGTDNFPLPDASYVDIADANNDGYLDMISSTQYAGQVITYYWNSTQNKYTSITRPGSNYDQAVWGNFDKNDTLDVLIGSRTAGQEINVIMNNYAGRTIKITDPGVEGITFSSLFSVQAVDFDNDGDDDIVAGKYEAGGDLFFYRNDNLTFVLTDTVKSPMGSTARIQEIKKADFDGDGYLDIVVSNNNWPNDKGFMVLKNNSGNGTFSTAYTAVMDNVNDGRYGSFDVKDINGDGKMDIHMRINVIAESAFKVGIWMNDGNMNFTRSYKSLLTKDIGGFAMADFNLDGKLDISYFQGNEQDTAAVMLGDGTGNFTTVAYLDTQDKGYYQGNKLYMAFDANKDGKPDMVTRNAIHFNNLDTRPPRGLMASYSFSRDFVDETGDSDGTNSGAAFASDRNGNENSALFFNGVDAFVDLGDVNMPDKGEMHDSLTITMWVKVAPDSPSGGIFTRRVTEGQAYMSLFFNKPEAPIWNSFPTETPSLVWMATGPFYTNPFEAKATTQFDKWHFLAVSKLGDKTIMYMDGARIDSAADSYDYKYNGAYTGFGNAIIGVNPAWKNESNNAAFKGYIDDIKVYSGALKDQQIQENFETEKTDMWMSSLNVVQGAYSANAHFGMNETATDGLDQQLDTPEPPEASGNNVRAWFAHPEWNGTISNNYTADIRLFKALENTSETWLLNVKTTISGEGSINLTRPVDFPYPIVVKSNGMIWVSRDADIQIPFTSDGSSVLQFEIMAVGDNTPPTLEVSGNMEGPAIWDNTVDRELSWTATDTNLEFVELEYTTNGEEWTSIYKGTEQSSMQFNIPDMNMVHSLRFRVKAVDIAQNTAVFNTMYPISIVSPVQQVPYVAGWNLRGLSFKNVDMENSVFAKDVFLFDWSRFTYMPTMDYRAAKGYWLGSYESGSETISGSVAETNMLVKSFSGWSMLASPLLRPVNTDSIKVKDLSNGQVYSFNDALTAQLVTNVFGYTPGETYHIAPVMDPLKGYWFGVLTDSVEVEIPIHHHVPQVAKSKNIADVNNIAAVAIEDGKFITAVALGTDVQINVPTPPAVPNASRIGLLGEETILGDTYFTMMVDSELGAEIPLITGGEAREIKLSWLAQTFTDGMTYELHGSNGEIFNLSDSGDYLWNTGDENAPILVVKPFGTANEVVNLGLPTEISLSQNYPNPFNPSTSIKFALPESGNVTLSVFNLLGQKVATLVNGVESAGYHTVQFDASRLSSGIYLYRLETAGSVMTKQMVLIK